MAANAYPCGMYRKRTTSVNAKSMLGLLSISQLSCRQLKRFRRPARGLARLLSEEDQDNANG